MRNKLQLQPVLIPYVVLFYSLFLFNSCKNKVPAADAEINSAFEATPPIAEDITVKILEKPVEAGNVLLTARLDKNIVKDKYHAVMVSDEKMVLRDDGKGGDENAGDGVFSIILKEDVGQFRNELIRIQRDNIEFMAGKRNLFKWVNRSAVPINEKIRNFSAAKFDTA